MPSFSSLSLERLDTCHTDIQILFNIVVLDYDCSVLEGYRGEEAQTTAFSSGRSKTKWPNSKHNTSPSLAIDIAPYVAGRGIPWPNTPDAWDNVIQRNNYLKDLAQFYHFAGYVIGVAKQLDISIRWGGDWDMDADFRDNKFDDLVHFELLGVKHA